MNFSIYGIMPPDDVSKWSAIRHLAEKKLVESNWTQLPDARITPAKKAEWDVYREYLNTIETRFANPDDVVFIDPPVDERTPTAPSEVTFNKPVVVIGDVSASDYLLLTPDIDKDADKAHTQAMGEFNKGKGVPKSVGTMAMANTFVIDELLKRIAALEANIK